MSETEKNDLLKICITRDSGNKIEFEFKKLPEELLGLSSMQISILESELVYDFKSALFNAKAKGKNEININFNI